MENLLLVGRVIMSVIWAMFWVTVAVVYVKNKVEFKAAFSRLGKKFISSIVKITIFLIIFNVLLWSSGLSIMKNYESGLFIYLSTFIGYVLLAIGTILSLSSVLKLGKMLPLLEMTNVDFRKNRNLMYSALALIATGSSLVIMNATALLLAIIFALYLMHRIKVENKI